MLNLITKDNLGFTKKKCNCGITSKINIKNSKSKINNKYKRNYKKTKTRKYNHK